MNLLRVQREKAQILSIKLEASQLINGETEDNWGLKLEGLNFIT